MIDSNNPQDAGRELGRTAFTGPEGGALDLASLRAWLRGQLEQVAAPDDSGDVILWPTRSLSTRTYMRSVRPNSAWP